MESREERYKGEESSVEVSGREMVVALGDGSREGGGGGKDDPKNSSSSLMLGLLDEFTKIYSDRLQRVEETAMKCDQQQYWENKVRVLESWVRDLGEQNAVLVVTVEELEREAADRVALLEDRLAKMATTTRESCVSLRDHQIQVSSLVTDKIGLEKKAQSLGEKMLALERRNVCLKEENNNLQSDLTNLVQVITRARQTGQWEADDLTFSCVTPEQVFGTVLSSSRRSSQSLKESQHDYIHQIFEDRLRKDNSSLASSFSNLQDADSAYGGRGSEKDLLIMKLKADLRSLQATHEETNRQLLERDKHIADLQTQLTDTHHELALSQAEVNSVNHTLQEARHRSRHENVEMTRKEEVIRHLLSKQSVFKKDSTNTSVKSLCDLDNVITGENNVEAQLGKNIDVLVSRLAELEEECQQVRDQHAALQNTHALCTPTINMLREQLNRSHQTQVELRTVLTAEVAQRHDQLVALRDELKEQEQKHHETQMQLQLKTEVIKDLRKEVRDMKERQYIVDDKNALTSLKEGVYSGTKETKSSETQTQQVFSSKNESLAEETSRSPNGFYSPSQPSQISKLENELAEKSVLLRELQSHLAASRQELHLKDETLQKLELKLDSSRREGCQKGERMQYLTGQLTSLQLEVGRTHGQAEQLRRQVEKKTELIEKMESENSSLTHQLNEKSATLERFQTELLKTSTDLERKRKEVSEQKMMIRTLQEALVASKRSCDELRSRLDSDVTVRESRAERLERELKDTQSLHHHAFTQLVESGGRVEVLQEENRALSRRVTALQQDLAHAHKQEARQTTYWKGRAEDVTHKLSLSQKEVQTLEEELAAAAEARVDADKQVEEMQKRILQQQQRLSPHETSESVERLGEQLEEAVAALTEAREEARRKGEQLRRARQDADQLSDALGYEKDLNTTLHDQVEGLMKEATMQEHKVGELQQDLRRVTRDTQHKDTQLASLQSQLEGLKNQVSTMEDLLDEEQREVASLSDSLAQETKHLHDARARCDKAMKEAARAEEQVATLQRELQEAQEKISLQERRIRDMESEKEREVAAVGERLRVAHEESVKRLEDALLTYTHMQAHDEYQVESLEESLAEVGGRLAESEAAVKEVEKERDSLGQQLEEEAERRESDARDHHTHLMRLTEENSLLKTRLEGVHEETQTWQQHCDDLEERHSLVLTDHSPHYNCHLHQAHLAKALQQVVALKEALKSTNLEKNTAEEERGHAHEQVLSLIRECNSLEEQIHRLAKDKCRLQEQVSSLEDELHRARDDAQEAKDQLAMKVEQLVALERELENAKTVEGGDAGCGSGGRDGGCDKEESCREVVMARREASAARRALVERETQVRMTQLRVTALERSLQHRQHEVTGLEEKLQEAETATQRLETEVVQLRAQVTTLSTQLTHARRHTANSQPQEDKVSERAKQETKKTVDLQQEVTALIRSRDEALRKVSSMEATVGNSQETMEATKLMEKLWEAQLATIEEEMARLLCESNQLKDCNAALHHQVSTREAESENLRRQVRAREAQLEELHHARELLANDAQVVVAAVKQWLHEQKTANTKLSSKLHQQNKHILLLNTEKQFLAERNTSLQRTNHDLSIQLQDLRARLGLPVTPASPEKLGRMDGILRGLSSPPLGPCQSLGMSPTRPLSSTAYLDNVLGLVTPLDNKHEDVLSTCSSEGSSNSSGCQVPGPDLPGAAHLDRLAHLADSLLIASRNISRASGIFSHYNSGQMTSATSLGDLTSTATLGHLRSTLALTKTTSSSVGNLTSLFPQDRRDKAQSPVSILGNRVGDLCTLSPGSKVKCRGTEVILAAPVRERRSSSVLMYNNNDSIEEADEEESSTLATNKTGTLQETSNAFDKSSRTTSSSSSLLSTSCSGSQGSSRTSPASSASQGSSSTLQESSCNIQESFSTLQDSSSISSVTTIQHTSSSIV
nr:myosin-14-like isoform X2 [Procambarus clarkii]